MKKPLISIIILDFLKGQKVVQNVQSALTQVGDFELEILVGDNSNNPQNAEILKEGLASFSNVSFYIFDENYGYTKGNNILASKAKGDYIAVVNPDIIWDQKDSLQILLKNIQEDQSIGIIAPHQKNPDGSSAMTVRDWPKMFVQVARRTFLRNLPKIKEAVELDEKKHFDYTKSQNVEWIQSSFLIISKDLWNKIGGFDERYFLFMGDTELSWQVWEKQKRVFYCADTTVLADGIRLSGGGVWALFSNKVIRQHIKDSWTYTKLHKRKNAPLVLPD